MYLSLPLFPPSLLPLSRATRTDPNLVIDGKKNENNTEENYTTKQTQSHTQTQTHTLQNKRPLYDYWFTHPLTHSNVRYIQLFCVYKQCYIYIMCM